MTDDRKSVPSVSVSYARTGNSAKANALGMRPMQERAYEKRGEQYLLIKSPPASGKSRALMFVALDKLANQGLRQAIIVVPEKSIGASFNDEPLSRYGFWADWHVAPRWNLCNAPGEDGGKVKSVGAFLESDDQVLVCTHATFRFAVDRFGAEAFDDRLIAVDEFHHVSSSPDNKLGLHLGDFIARDKVHLVAMTGSYFRGDAEAVLSPGDEAKFESVTYTYYEQLNGYEYLKQLDIGYFFYSGPYADDILAVLDPAEKTIIHIPNVNSRESTGEKIKEVEHIIEALGEWQGADAATGFQLVRTPDGRTLRIADLVDDDAAKRDRVYAVRLDRLRALEDCSALLMPLDHQKLLAAVPPATSLMDDLDIDDLAAELEGAAGRESITQLRHVRASADKRVAEEIAERDKCEDFDRFKPLFTDVQRDLDAGLRTTRPFVRNAGLLKADITENQFFILGGQIAYVAEVGETFRAPNGETDARLRVIYSNGTESNLLRRSLQRALYKDEAGRRITEATAGPLFASESDGEDEPSGTIYVLRSNSEHPLVAAHRGVLHKIGVTGGDVSRRIANAKFDPTFLMASVEVVATYTLYNINRIKLENLIHRIFDPARLDIEIKDRFGTPVIPREWFLVPRHVVADVVERIKDGTVTEYRYDPSEAGLVRQ